jgi:galactose mutarotase-like enzyme
VVLGYEDLDGYLTGNDGCMGACVGRYANRIAGGAFELDGREYRLTVNDGENTLHGGRGWAGRVFDFRTEENAVEFSLSDRDGADGFPGNLTVKVKYTLTDENEVVMDYFAVSDSDTVLNITNHSYFNLACGGDGAGSLGCRRTRIFIYPWTASSSPRARCCRWTARCSISAPCGPIGPGFYDHSLVLNGRSPARQTVRARLRAADGP